MALTPEDIEAHIFKVARRGYDKVEVDRFLGQVATDYRQLHQAAEAAGANPTATPTAAYTPTEAVEQGESLPRRVPPAIASRSTTGGGALFALAGNDEPVPVEPEVAPEIAADEPTPAAAEVAAAAPEAVTGDGDDFNRLGSEVANVLRTAHHSVATLRQEAEVEAALIRQRAERDIDELRREADDYAARVRVEADAYAADRANEAHVSRREADRILAEARAKAELANTDADTVLAEARARADVAVADAEAKARAALADADTRAAAALAAADFAADAKRAAAETEAAALVAETERRVAGITEQAEASARSRATEILAEADRRLYDADRQLAQARQAEAALREKLAAAHGDLAAALSQFSSLTAAEPLDAVAAPSPGTNLEEAPLDATALEDPDELTIDLTDPAPSPEPEPVADVLDLTDQAADPSTEPEVPAGWPGPAPAPSRPDDLFGDRNGAVATAEPLVADPSAATSPTAAAPDVDSGEDDPLTGVVRDAIGRAVQSAMQRTDDT